MEMQTRGRWPLACAVHLGAFLAFTASLAAAPDEKLDQLVTLNFEQTPLKDVLDYFAKDFGLNFAWASRASDDERFVTAKMKDVPIRTAIEAIATAAGLTCEFVGGNVAVLKIGGKSSQPGRGPTPPARPRDGPLLVHGFERGLDGWYAPRVRLGEIEIDGQAARTDREDDVKVGKGSLEWRYEYAPARLSAILRPVRLDMAVKEFRVWLKTERAPVTLLVGLKERDGSEYQAVLQLDTQDRWDLHRLSPTDFALDEDSEDENHTLDSDQVREISFADVTGIFQQIAGENTIWLDDFTVE